MFGVTKYRNKLPPQTQHKAVAAGGGGVGVALAVILGYYLGMDHEVIAALGVVLGFLIPYLSAYWTRNWEKRPDDKVG